MTTNAVVRIHRHGGPECLSLDELPLPTPQPDEVLIEVEAAGVNFVDTQFRSGFYNQPLPLALGSEGAGVIHEVGADVAGLRPGDRVGWVQSSGSYAKWKVIAAGQYFVASDGCKQSGRSGHAAARDDGALSWLFNHPLAPGETCVVHSAAGGVGQLLTRLAKMRGAKVIAAVSTPAKAEAAAENGADHVVVYAKDDLPKVAKRVTDGRGVDVVYDAVGKDTFEQSLACLRPRGLLALYGEASGPVPPFNVRQLFAAGSVYLTRTGLNAYAATPEERRLRGNDVLSWVARGDFKPRIDSMHGLEAAADAHRAIEGRTTIGKVLLLPQGRTT